MRSLTSTIRTATSKVAVIIGRTILLALAVLVALVVWGLVVGGSTDTHDTEPVQVAPAATPTTAGDGTADHGLFSDTATLDMSHIDDLREDPYGKCVSLDGVLTPTGVCVDAARIWRDEVDSGTWETLRELGYAPEAFDPTEMWVPAEYVILGGADGNEVLAVDIFRPVTPRAL
jgi:hypothetical protein